MRRGRTSLSHPLQIAEIRPALEPNAAYGRIGVTFCPGKKQLSAVSGAWDRDLGIDLDAIAAWGAAAVVTLVEEHELESLQVTGLGAEVRARHMAWYHLPIRDVSVPDAVFEAAWESAGEHLRRLVRSGFAVLVHCKGGLGRAGTIAARLLAELGMAPPEAIKAVRRVRPGSMETRTQEAHVAALKPVLPEPPLTTPAAQRDRALGALLGLAVGDALGTTLEFKPRGSFTPLTDMIGGGPFRLAPGQWTDDTAMALALADSLIHYGKLDEADLMARFTAWYERGDYSCTGRCFDIGLTTRAALLRWCETGIPQAGSSDPRSAGNGSLMRLAPVALRYWRDPTALRDAAQRQSMTTHAAAEAVDACTAYGELLGEVIAGMPLHQALMPREGPWRGAIAPIMAGSWRGKPRGAIRSSGYVAHSLEAALWAVGQARDFSEAVLLAANLGEDADTTAAIAGQLAGAAWGASAIPPAWLERLAWGDRIRMLGEQLFDA